MFDIDSVSDAELGAIFRQQIKARLAEKINGATPAVLAQRAKAEAASAAAIAFRQDERRQQVLPGFTVGKRHIPDLDLTQVTDLHEVVSAKQRSIYNKALYAIGEDILDADTTTYLTLLETHERLSQVKPTKKGKKKGKKVQAVLAVTDQTDKVATVASILGISKKAARKLVNA